MGNAVNLRGRRAALPTTVSGLLVSGMLDYGTYDVWSDGDMFIGVGPIEPNVPGTLVGFTADDGYFVPAGNIVSVVISKNSDRIVFAGAGAANAKYHAV